MRYAFGGVSSPTFDRLPSGSLSWDVVVWGRGGFVRCAPCQAAMTEHDAVIKGLAKSSLAALQHLAKLLNVPADGKRPAIARRIIEWAVAREELFNPKHKISQACKAP